MKTITCPIYLKASDPQAPIAIIDENGKEWSYAELHNAIEIEKEHLKSAKNTVIAWTCQHHISDIIRLWACFRAKLIAFPLSKDHPESTRQHYLSISQAVDLSSNILQVSKSEKKLSPTSTPPSTICLNAIATYLLTSGSSGRPKIAVHRFKNHYINASAALHNHPLIPGDRYLLDLPLYHVGGIGILFRSFSAGSSIVILNRKKDVLPSLSTFISKKQITHMSMVPTQLYRWLNTKNFSTPTTLQCLLIGGCACPTTLIKQAKDKLLPIFTTYGLTEMASQVCTQNQEDQEKPGSEEGSGQALCEHTIKIDASGKIWVKGPALFMGYLIEKNIIQLATDPNGYFNTNDMGKWSKNGQIILNGRADRCFISGGENIHPEEIENALLNIPSIEAAKVTPTSDPEFGQRPIAHIKSKKALTQDYKNELNITLQKHLAKYKLPIDYQDWQPQKNSTWKTQ